MLKRLASFDFWDKALARAIRTACQSILAALTGCAVIGDANVPLILATIAVPVLTSILMSIIAGIPEITDEDFV